MSEYEKVVTLYPRIKRVDFEFLEAFRLWLSTTKDEEAIRNYFNKAIRESSITPGLISMILAGHKPKKILMYPYDEAPLHQVKISQQTLFKLNNVVKLIKWRPTLDTHGLHLEQVNSKSRARQALYNACISDLDMQQCLTKLGVDIPIVQTNALGITLCPDLKIKEVPESLIKCFDYGIGISITGVSIGFSLEIPKFSWFICVDVDIQKTIDYIDIVLNCNCQSNSRITIATKLR